MFLCINIGTPGHGEERKIRKDVSVHISTSNRMLILLILLESLVTFF